MRNTTTNMISKMEEVGFLLELDNVRSGKKEISSMPLHWFNFPSKKFVKNCTGNRERNPTRTFYSIYSRLLTASITIAKKTMHGSDVAKLITKAGKL